MLKKKEESRMKNLILLICLLVSISASGQVTALNYLLHYDCDNNLYEVKIKILEGSAVEAGERVQFNSQISLVVPTGLEFEIIELNNPIENNQLYNGTTPCEWNAFTPVVAPVEQPENDFYSIAPQLSPASFYNNLNEGDELILFHCKIGSGTEYNQDIRFYNNETDPQISSSGSDFRNGFAIGSPNQIYITNEYSSCLTDVFEVDENISIYPNPFSDKLIIEMESVPSYLFISDVVGVVVHEERSLHSNSVEVSTQDLNPGLYLISYKNKEGYHTKKVIKY